MDKKSLIEKSKTQGITSTAAVAAIETVPRVAFVQPFFQDNAYGNYPLPIGHNETISQSYIVARMIEIVLTASTKNVFEIGTESGYQAAIILTASTGSVPPTLLEQLTGNGRLLQSLGTPGLTQQLQLIIRKGKTFLYETYDPVTFVPLLTGRTAE